MPGALRRRASASTRTRHDQERRGRDHRPGVVLGYVGRARRVAVGRTVAVVGCRAGRARRRRSSSPGPVTRSRSTSGPTGSAVCCATASPSSRWRRPSSTTGSTRCGEGTVFRAGSTSAPSLPGDKLLERYDAVVLAVGSTVGRDLPVPGRDLDGIHQAMEYLPQSNRVVARPGRARADHRHRQGRRDHRRRRHRRRLPRHGDPPGGGVGHPARDPAQPPSTGRRPALAHLPDDVPVSSAHEEAGERVYAVSTHEFVDDGSGRVRALRLVEVDASFQPVEGTEREIPAGLVLLAMGFTGPERPGCSSSSGSRSTSAATSRGTRRTPRAWTACSSPATRVGVSR